jgi:hypothetical protein
MKPIDIAYQFYCDNTKAKQLTRQEFIDALLVDNGFNDKWGENSTNELGFNDRVALYVKRGWKLNELNYNNRELAINLLDTRGIPKREIK